MRILLTGGGTGGHFYPIIAIAQAINKLAKEGKLVDVELYYMAPQPYDSRALYENKITFIQGSAGKMRRYFSILNFFDIFRTAWGLVQALWRMYFLYPDVIFGKGGHVSFPALFAARFFRIPVVIHESDSVPGRVNRWAGKFARKIAVSFPQAAEHFPKEKIAYTGNPVRQELLDPNPAGGHEFFGLDKNIPTIFIIGGSQGSQIINDNVVNALPKLVAKYQIVHQTGKNNLDYVKQTASVNLYNNPHQERYKPLENLNVTSLKMIAGIADVVVSRSGSTIFEIAMWKIPAILIPITDSNGDHQRKNAYNYARTGAAIVVEENNLTPNLLASEIDRLITDTAEREKMKQAAEKFARADSAQLIAQEILTIALEHEK